MPDNHPAADADATPHTTPVFDPKQIYEAFRRDAIPIAVLGAAKPDAAYINDQARAYVAARLEREALTMVLDVALAGTPEGKAYVAALDAYEKAQDALAKARVADSRTERITALTAREEAAKKALLAAWPDLIPSLGKSVPLPEGRVTIGVKEEVEVKDRDAFLRDVVERRLTGLVTDLSVDAKGVRSLLKGTQIPGVVPKDKFTLSFTAKKTGA